MPETEASDMFRWTVQPWGRMLQCRPLLALVDHGFTTRDLAISSPEEPRRAGWPDLAQAFGVVDAAIVHLRQVHGTGVVVINEPPPGLTARTDGGTGDIAITNRTDVLLTVRVADCVPILLADPRTGAVGAAHAGWRGTAAGVACQAVGALVSSCGSHPADLVVAIGPSIGPCCYRVGADVRDSFGTAGRWRGLADRWFSTTPPLAAMREVPGREPGRAAGRPPLWLDTWTANLDQLVRAGVPDSQVHVARLCTACHRDVFHSYRVDGAAAGRTVAAIRARGPSVGT